MRTIDEQVVYAGDRKKERKISLVDQMIFEHDIGELVIINKNILLSLIGYLMMPYVRKMKIHQLTMLLTKL